MTVAGLLKLYFRESLTFPITKELTKNIIEIWSMASCPFLFCFSHRLFIRSFIFLGADYPDHEEKKGAFGSLLGDLSRAQFHTLHVLFQLLLRVVQFESENKMNPNNLSKVFGLSLFHDLTPTTANSVVEFWMLNFSEVFSPPSFPDFI